MAYGFPPLYLSNKKNKARTSLILGNLTILIYAGPKGEGGLDDATGQAGKGGDEYMKPKAKKRRGIEFESKARNAMQEISSGEVSEKAALQSVAAENGEGKSNWSFEKILAKVIGLDSDDADSNLDPAPVKEEQWSLKSLFEKKK